jgi:hypothetical protein
MIDIIITGIILGHGIGFAFWVNRRGRRSIWDGE